MESKGVGGLGQNLKELWVAESTHLRLLRIRMKTAYLGGRVLGFSFWGFVCLKEKPSCISQVEEEK